MKLKWIVEFEVDESWVADGFELTDERALDMLSRDLRYAHIGTELGAKVLKAPAQSRIRKLQGYEPAAAESKEVSALRSAITAIESKEVSV